METLTVTICRSHGIFWRAPLLPSRDEYSQRSNSRQSRDQVQEPMAGLWAITLGIHRSPFQLSTPLAKRAVARGFQWFCGRASGQRLSATAASVNWTPDSSATLDSESCFIDAKLARISRHLSLWSSLSQLLSTDGKYGHSQHWEVLPSRSIPNSCFWNLEKKLKDFLYLMNRVIQQVLDLNVL